MLYLHIYWLVFMERYMSSQKMPIEKLQ
uniref:F-box/kelch-repeat protein At1g22040-like n=1 Tax=Rhizophora mucronata TaxID=61149 RepID=A0A2P2QW38_RHIMU